MIKLFSIIVIYNGMRRDWIQKCFSGLQNSSLPNQIIAVDNNSSDNSVEYIKTHFPDVLLLESKENLGFGGANNLGLKKALELGGEYFFLLNQDAWVEENTLEKLVTAAKGNPEFGIVSPIHLNGKGDALDYNFSNQIAPSHCKNLYSDFVLNKIKNKIYEANFICAAAWLLSKECLRKVGGFSPSFFHYGEDDNYIHRLHYKNRKIGVCPQAFIFHDREEREQNAFFEKSVLEERRWRLKLSNPNQQFDSSKYRKQLKNKILKYRLLRDKPSVNYYQRELQLLEKLETETLANLQLSISNKEYIFLNDESTSC